MHVNKKIVSKMINKYGKDQCSTIVMEECSELIQAVSKEKRKKHDKEHLAEEMVDVMICLEMLKQIYGIDDEMLEEWLHKKQKRNAERLR